MLKKNSTAEKCDIYCKHWNSKMLYSFCIWAKNGKLLPKSFWFLYWHCSSTSKPRIHSGYMALNFWYAHFRLALFWKGCLLHNFWDKTYADKPFWKTHAEMEYSVNIRFVAAYRNNSVLRLNSCLSSRQHTYSVSLNAKWKANIKKNYRAS